MSINKISKKIKILYGLQVRRSYIFLDIVLIFFAPGIYCPSLKPRSPNLVNVTLFCSYIFEFDVFTWTFCEYKTFCVCDLGNILKSWLHVLFIIKRKCILLFIYLLLVLYSTLSWRKPLSYRNQSIDLLCKSMDWFLYDNGLRHERVNVDIS